MKEKKIVKMNKGKNGQEAIAGKPIIGESLSLKETQRLLHEMRAHQIELEMQNEELRAVQAELDALRTSYFDLSMIWRRSAIAPSASRDRFWRATSQPPRCWACPAARW